MQRGFYNFKLRLRSCFFLTCLLFSFCKKDLITQVTSSNLQTTPSASVDSAAVLTVYASQVDTAIKTGGVILSNGGDSIMVVGMCWSKNHYPRLSTAKDSITKDKLIQKQFTSVITTLKPGEVYYGCAYITTAKGLTVYGQEVPMFVPPAALPQTGLVLLRALSPQAIIPHELFKVSYDSIAYKADTSNKITELGPLKKHFFAPVSGLYFFELSIGLTMSSPTPLSLDAYPVLYMMRGPEIALGGTAIAATTTPVPGVVQLSTIVHLNKGDSVSANLENLSNDTLYTNPSAGITRFGGYLVRPD